MKKIIVHGVHRSGTSLTASLFEKVGCHYAEEAYRMPTQEDNPKGFWERIDVVELNDEILATQNLNWFTLVPELSKGTFKNLQDKFGSRIAEVVQRLNKHDNWFLKDPRFSITWPLWEEYIDVTHHIVVHRHPVSVAQSLHSRNQIPIEHGIIFWYHQTRMMASALLDEQNISNIEFASQEHSGERALEIINEAAGQFEGHSKLTANDYKSIFDPKLIHHNEIDESLIDKYPTISQAWEYAKNGDFKSLLDLPPIQTSELSWQDLDSKNAIGSAYEKSNRDISGYKLALVNTQEELANTQKELTSTRVELSESHEKIENLDERLLTISGELKNFMYSKRYIAIVLGSKVISKLGLLRHLTLDNVFNIAKFGYSHAELEKVLPKLSNRDLLLHAFFQNPLSFIKRINLSRLKKGLLMLLGRGETDIGARQALQQYVTIETDNSLDIFDPERSDDWVNESIQFEVVDCPKVSIVIPVYNNYLTTLACLHSIKKYTDKSLISYEVIIADDCSSDETVQLEDVVKGLRIIRGEHNLGFLQNCNHAIQYAKGEYVALLNNDTNVQAGWLEELLKPHESDSGVGVTGPMFVYPDGRLQEAGGIIFSDGSGWNYGRFEQPDKPEYNFTRDVDYISGACLVFRQSLWEDIGGFDTQFSPAYYEDTDFCFEVRKRGLLIRFVPTSKVVHFEGVSHGNNEDFGVKKYQALNRDKFASKWRSVLEKDHYVDGNDLFKARLRGKAKKILLFVDHHVPFYDKDAGSKVAQRYIELLLQEGIHVIFMGDNFYPHQPYTSELQSLGVEVIYGDYYKKSWFEWLQDNSDSIDAIYLNRPHIAENYIDQMLTLKEVPYLAYHGADLHYVRVGREKELGIANNEERTAEQWKSLEFDLMRKCDVSLWLSDLEVQLINEEDSSISVAYKPMYWFEQSEIMHDAEIVSEPNLLFVGSFGHPPNKDGLDWFLNEIYPQVLVKFPKAKLSIIGSNCPEEIRQLQSDNINVLGFVSEPELINAYRTARVAVVPLRYGAGVKGKVIESMQNGVTVMTTPVGAEGLPGDALEYLNISDQADTFSNSLISLLEDDALCAEKVALSNKALKKHFSRESAINAVNTIMGERG